MSGLPTGGARGALYENFTLLCHSEECSDEESAFDFSVLLERIGESAKQMLHFVQHDTTANSDRPKDSFSLAAFAPLRESLRLGCGYAALCPS
jgi:hypothetical protein